MLSAKDAENKLSLAIECAESAKINTAAMCLHIHDLYRHFALGDEAEAESTPGAGGDLCKAEALAPWRFASFAEMCRKGLHRDPRDLYKDMRAGLVNVLMREALRLAPPSAPLHNSMGEDSDIAVADKVALASYRPVAAVVSQLSPDGRWMARSVDELTEWLAGERGQGLHEALLAIWAHARASARTRVHGRPTGADFGAAVAAYRNRTPPAVAQNSTAATSALVPAVSRCDADAKREASVATSLPAHGDDIIGGIISAWVTEAAATAMTGPTQQDAASATYEAAVGGGGGTESAGADAVPVPDTFCGYATDETRPQDGDDGQSDDDDDVDGDDDHTPVDCTVGRKRLREEWSDDSGGASGAEHPSDRPARRQRTHGPPDDVGQDYEAVGLEEKLARCVSAFKRRSSVGRGPLASHTPSDAAYHDFAWRWRVDRVTGIASPTCTTKALIHCIGDCMAYVVAKMCVGDEVAGWLGMAVRDEQLSGPMRGPTAVPPRKPSQRARWHAHRLFRQCADAIGLLEDPLLGMAAMRTVDSRAIKWCAALADAEMVMVLPRDE